MTIVWPLIRKYLIFLFSALPLSYFSLLFKGFMGIEKEMEKGTWYVKCHAKRAQLAKENRLQNKRIEKIHRHVEHEFGRVKVHFRMFHKKFRHFRTWISPLWRFVCVLHITSFWIMR